MHSNVIIKNVSWPHFSWPILYGKTAEPCTPYHLERTRDDFSCFTLPAWLYASQGDGRCVKPIDTLHLTVDSCLWDDYCT